MDTNFQKYAKFIPMAYVIIGIMLPRTMMVMESLPISQTNNVLKCCHC